VAFLENTNFNQILKPETAQLFAEGIKDSKIQDFA
jgi:hypothetical protein